METEGNVKIAGNHSVNDWKKLKTSLNSFGGPTLWGQAHRDFFVKRLETRYFEPIQLLQESNALQGEGFANRRVAFNCGLASLQPAGST